MLKPCWGSVGFCLGLWRWERIRVTYIEQSNTSTTYKHKYSESSLNCCSTGETSFTGWFFVFNAQKCLNGKPTAVNEQSTAAEYQSCIMKVGIA